jgi:ABC-type transport system involved in multi-copper enzyme maturation permease subunit
MLRPLTFLLGPIFAKEMVEMSRRARYYFNRVFYGSALLIAAFVVWQENHWRLQRGFRLIEAMADLANELFLTVSCMQCAAVFLFVPIFLCGVISSEREDRTIDLLFTTSLTDREIVLGKLASRLAVVVLIIMSALPVLSLLMLFGGIDPAALWQVEMATLVAMIYAGAHAIYFSATSRSPMGALLRTYWWLSLWLLALPAFVVAILASTTPNPFVPVCQFFLSVLACVNPIGPFFIAVEPRLAGMLTSGLGAWSSFLTSAVPLAWSAFLIIQATRHLRMMPGRPAPWADRIPGVRLIRSIRKKCGSVYSVVDGYLVRWRRYGEVTNPLWQRARLAPVYDRDGYLRRIESLSWFVAFAFFLLFAIAEPRDLFDEEGAMAFMGFTWAAVALLALVVSASGLVGDRRRGMLELMLAAPIEPREFVDGSLRAVWEHIRRIYCLPLVLTAIFVVGDPPIIGSLCSLVTATLFLAVLLMMGTLCSLTARSAATALAMTIILPIVMLIGILLLTATAEEAAGPTIWVASGLFLAATRYWTRRSVSTVAVGCHFIAVHLAINAVASCWTYDAQHEEFPMAAMHPGFLAIVTLDQHASREFHRYAPWFVVVPCYWAALVANLVWARRWMIRHFDRLVGRVQQTQSPNILTEDLLDRIWAKLRQRFFPQPRAILPAATVGWVESSTPTDTERSRVVGLEDSTHPTA